MDAVEMKKIEPTPEQHQIMDAMRGHESVMVTAYAGCAKTTTLGLASQRVKVPALALAFNKAIVKDFGSRFPGNFEVKTLNGLGFAAWRGACAGVNKWDIQDKKLGKLLTETSKGRKIDLNGDQWDVCRRLVTQAMLWGLVPRAEGEDRGLVEDTTETWLAIGDHLWLDPEETEFYLDLCREVLEKDIQLARQGIISFDDQVYCPTVLEGRFPKFPLVMVDEAQDLSGLNHQMLRLCLQREGARLVAVGDPKQAIYAFRGADSQSMGKMLGLRGNWQELPLATTFRCPKSVVARQQGHAPGFTAWHTNTEGKIARFARPEAGGPGWTYEDFAGLAPGPQASMAILCRNNGPLFALAFKLIRRGVGVVVKGRDIGKNLVQLSKKLLPDDGLPAAECAAKVEAWRERDCDLARANGREEKIASIADRAECLQAVLEGASCRDAGDLRRQLERLFAREHGMVELSSIHKAKGLEWDLVMHLDPWRIPSRQAKKLAAAGDASQLDQEWNLRYVAETRTKHTLVEASLEDFQ